MIFELPDIFFGSHKKRKGITTTAGETVRIYKKGRKSLTTSGFFKKSGDIFFGATSQIKKSCLVARLFYFAVRGVCEITEDAGRGDSAESANIAENGS